MHRLDSAADVVEVVDPVILADAAARLHRVSGDAVNYDTVTNDVISIGECCLGGRRVPNFMEKGFVPWVVIPYCLRRTRGSLFDVNHRWQRVVINFNQFGRILCKRQSFGNNEGDWLTDEANAIIG